MLNTREDWLYRAKNALEPLFTEQGYQVPPVKLSCGFASTGAIRHIGECFPTTLSANQVNEIFISPVLDDPIDVLDTLMHEMVHAVDDCKHKHGREFKKIALSVGLEGQMRSAHASEKLKESLSEISKKLGEYPHRKLFITRKSGQVRERPKAVCELCGYEARVQKKWQYAGPPICPQHQIPMAIIGAWVW